MRPVRHVRRSVLAAAGSLLLLGGLLPAAAVPALAISPDVVISQVYGGGGNSGATLRNDFVELYNRGTAAVPIDGWSVQYASATGSTWQVTALGGLIPPGRHYLVQQAQGAGGTQNLPQPDATGTIAMGGTAGKVALVTNATALTTVCGVNCDTASGVRDFVGFGTTANDFEGAGPTPAPSNTTAALRAADGATDTDSNSADFATGAPNPRNCGSDCVPPPPPTGCDVAVTHQIAQVQGDGNATPIAGQAVRVEGVVTGDFNATNGLGGFYMQDDTPDGLATTSDGVFVASAAAVDAGQRVRVSGTAAESFAETRVNATAVDICGTGSVAATAYDLPRPDGVTFEPVEGTLLTFPEALTATEHFQLGRFGEITVSADGRLYQPTDRVAPGAPAQALIAESQRRRLLIDDASNVQNPATVPFLQPEALRIGDTATGITGVLGFGFSVYRLQPTAPISFTRTNPRPTAPASVGGDIKVASFNTLNYFTTLTTENPDARGANSTEEFARQQTKEVAAILGMDADVLGLMEVENNGTEAISSLVEALNASAGAGTYAFIVEPTINAPNEFGGTFGTDAIKASIIYQPASVTPVGAAQTSIDPIFDRPPLIQSFELAGGSADFTVVVNHFKSKNCAPGSAVGDADQGDGQSCFNARRVAQATELVDVLDTLAVPDPLVIGDLNAYTEEDPIHVLENAGYVGLSETFIAPADRYSFVFDGFSGELDHALAAASLLNDVTGATIWHINADEPLMLDYNLDFGRDPGLYDPDAYRTSDHDPLIVGLDLDESPTSDAGGPYAVGEGGSVSVAATGSDPDGDAVTWAWDLDNDGTFETAGQSATFSAAGIDGPASRTIAVQATAGGQSVTDEATVTVNNVDPTATFDAPSSTVAGVPFTLALSSPADGSSADLAALTYSFDCGDGAGYGAFGTATSRSCPTTDTGSRTVRGTVRDDDGGSTEYTATVSVGVTYDSLCALGRDLVSRSAYGRVLCATLASAEAAEDRGQNNVKNTLLRAYRLEVGLIRRAGGLTADEAALLTQLSTRL